MSIHRSPEATTGLHEERLQAVIDAIQASSARSLLDLGCGDGDVLVRLAQDSSLERILAIDLDAQCLQRLRSRLQARRHSSTAQRQPRVELLQSSFTAADTLPSGYDCAILIEAIEHIEPRELTNVERAGSKAASQPLILKRSDSALARACRIFSQASDVAAILAAQHPSP